MATEGSISLPQIEIGEVINCLGISVSNSQIGPSLNRGLRKPDIKTFQDYRQVGESPNTNVQPHSSLRHAHLSELGETVSKADTPSSNHNAHLKSVKKNEQATLPELKKVRPGRTYQLKNITTPSAFVATLRVMMQKLANRKKKLENVNMPIKINSSVKPKKVRDVKKATRHNSRMIKPPAAIRTSLTKLIQSRDKPTGNYVPNMRMSLRQKQSHQTHPQITTQRKAPVRGIQKPIGEHINTRSQFPKRKLVPHMKHGVIAHERNWKIYSPNKKTNNALTHSDHINKRKKYHQMNGPNQKAKQVIIDEPLALMLLSNETVRKHISNDGFVSKSSRVSHKSDTHTSIAAQRNTVPEHNNAHNTIPVDTFDLPVVHIRQIPSRKENVPVSNTLKIKENSIPNNIRAGTGPVEPRKYAISFWSIFDQLLRDVDALVRLQRKDKKHTPVKTKPEGHRNVNTEFNTAKTIEKKNIFSGGDGTSVVQDTRPVKTKMTPDIETLATVDVVSPPSKTSPYIETRPTVVAARPPSKTSRVVETPTKLHQQNTNVHVSGNKSGNKENVIKKLQPYRGRQQTDPADKKRTFTIVERLSGNVISVIDGRAVLKSNGKPTSITTSKTYAKKDKPRARNNRLHQQSILNSKTRKKGRITNNFQSRVPHGSLLAEYQQADSVQQAEFVDTVPQFNILEEYGLSVASSVDPALGKERIAVVQTPRATTKYDVHDNARAITQMSRENKTKTHLEKLLQGRIVETTTTANVLDTNHIPERNTIPKKRIISNRRGIIDDPTHLKREENLIAENETSGTISETMATSSLISKTEIISTDAPISTNVSSHNVIISTNTSNDISNNTKDANITVIQLHSNISKLADSENVVYKTATDANTEIKNISTKSATELPTYTTEINTTTAASTTETPINSTPTEMILVDVTMISSTTPATTTTSTLPSTPTPNPLPAIFRGPEGYRLRNAGFHLLHPSSTADRLNITYANDDHVCPASRAVWRDYTVYLEVKPRRCMIQITWNARYKREPLYTGGWWGGNTEWTYRTVYDPEVRFVDLHYWYK